MASLTERERRFGGNSKVCRRTACMRLRVDASCCDSSYLSFISLQSCRCDTGAAAERAGEVPGAPGRQQPPCEGGGSRCPPAEGRTFLPPSAGSAASAAPGWPRIGGCYEWVGKSECAGWALMSFCEDPVSVREDRWREGQ